MKTDAKSTSNKSDKTSNGKWDKLLDDCENYIKEYAIHYRNSLKGNLMSLSKYPYMKAKTETLLKRLNKKRNKSLLTEEQLERVTKIQTTIIDIPHEKA